MPNKDLQKTYHYCPILDKKLSYENMKKIKSFFDNYEGDGTDEKYVNYGGKKMHEWLNKTLENLSKSVYYPKKSRMDAGEENQFKKPHTKDRDNSNPTEIKLPNVIKGSKHKYIMANKTVYESIEDELKAIRYLIEYMNKDKKIIK